jgi:hypothetical protein
MRLTILTLFAVFLFLNGALAQSPGRVEPLLKRLLDPARTCPGIFSSTARGKCYRTSG